MVHYTRGTLLGELGILVNETGKEKKFLLSCSLHLEGGKENEGINNKLYIILC